MWDAASNKAYTLQGHLSRDDTTHSGLGLPISVITRKCPHKLAYQSDGGIFLAEVPSSQRTPACVELGKKNYIEGASRSNSE